jgi:hypothetical protein
VLNERYRVLNMRDDGVEDAVGIVSAFVGAREHHDGNRAGAIRSVAREARASAAQIRALLQPSRCPKAISYGLFRRISAAYALYLRRKLDELEAEVCRVEALSSSDDRAAQDLADKARNLTIRIQALL